MRSSRIRGSAQRKDWACFNKSNRSGSLASLFPSFSRCTHGSRSFLWALFVLRVGMKRGHANILEGGGCVCVGGEGVGWGAGELLECIVMQSRCHSTFTFQASAGGGALACLETGLLRLAAGHRRERCSLAATARRPSNPPPPPPPPRQQAAHLSRVVTASRSPRERWQEESFFSAWEKGGKRGSPEVDVPASTPQP